MEVISTEKRPIKVWSKLDSVEEQAKQQLKNVANMPFIFKHVAAMPDVHFGLGATVGSVIATKNAIMPAAVGVDIGCGMMAVKTPLDHRIVQDKVKEIRGAIEALVPVGFSQHKSEIENEFKRWQDVSLLRGYDNDLNQKALRQMGTLGGGNHFIELCLDTESNVWVMLHSGSRGLGNIIARRHIETAKSTMKQMFIDLPDPDLAYFVTGTKDFNEYMFDLHLCQDYAFSNRQTMMNAVLFALQDVLGTVDRIPRILEVNCHHNYTEQENHFGENVWVTRKGAVRARANDYGIIPGSMGAKSFIVRGLGNPESFNSCSHGAGRKMSRTAATKKFTLADLEAQTSGVECRKDQGVLDEIPGAYKDIDEVMANQKDLVEIVAQLKQFMCIKGG